MSYRNMHGFSANTYSFINAKGEVFYFKMHLLTLQVKQIYLAKIYNEIITRSNHYHFNKRASRISTRIKQGC